MKVSLWTEEQWQPYLLEGTVIIWLDGKYGIVSEGKLRIRWKMQDGGWAVQAFDTKTYSLFHGQFDWNEANRTLTEMPYGGQVHTKRDS